MVDDLIRAACSNDVRKAIGLLRAMPSLAAFDLFTACICGDAETVRGLVAADPQLVHRKGGPLDIEPILYACYSRFLRADRARRNGIVEAARLLLDKGANPNASFWIDGPKQKWLQTALFGAAGIANDVELTTLLLDSGARFDPEDKETLYHTAEFPDPACLRLLLERAHVPIGQIKYCLGRVIDFEYPRHTALLLQHGADPNFRMTCHGLRTQMHKAVYLQRSAEIVRMLIDAGGDVNAVDEQGASILRSAVRNGDAAVIDLLRAHGARDDSITEMDALRGCPMTLCLAASRDDVATIDRLLDNGAPVDASLAGDQLPPLHCATWHGRFNATRRLVERGADIHAKNGYGGDAIASAIHGSTNCSDPNGGPSMRLPEEAFPGEYPRIIEYLIARGAKLPQKMPDDASAAVRELLTRHGVRNGEPKAG
jgi:ankyrin repeat protein